ncbi:hypothetical protein SPHINGOT1_270082 [Sphingomonas sp. T1]|nr:hypothetical protein SPHINGOT1_270082 [Sphingomonas sp. T1]
MTSREPFTGRQGLVYRIRLCG